MSKLIQEGEDFYGHINQEWLDNPENSIPDDYSSWGGFTKLHDDGLHNQIDIVKSLDDNNRDDERQKISAIWEASQMRFKMWECNKVDYKPIIDEIDILHNHFKAADNHISNIAKYLYYSQSNGIENVLDFDRGGDLKNTNHIVLDISTCGLSLPSRDYYFEDNFSDKLTQFRKHLENVMAILQRDTTVSLDRDFVEDVIDFETQIAKYTMKPDQSRQYDQYYTNTTLGGLIRELNKLNSLSDKMDNYIDSDGDGLLVDDHLRDAQEFFRELYSLFSFHRILRENLNKNFGDDRDVEKPLEDHITVYDGDSIRRCLNLIFARSNIQKYKSFLTYRIVTCFSSVCSKDLDNEYFNFYQRELDGQERQKPNEKRSIGLVNSLAGEMMGKLYVDRYFSRQAKENLQMSINKILEIMTQSLRDNDWLTTETKQRAIDKLSRFTSKIGFPDKWKDYSKLEIKRGDSLYQIIKAAKRWSLQVNFWDRLNSKVDKTEWHMTPQTINAYYSPNLNQIVFPAAILQPPFYHTSLDQLEFDISDEKQHLEEHLCLLAANLGGIGAVISHEITHGFDDQGRKFDEDGNLNNWWSDGDITLFNKKCDKVREIAKSYSYTDRDGKTHKMDPDLTMGENLADMGGLSIALKTLNSFLDSMEIDREINQRNSYRIFFKAWANIWKLNIKHDRKVMLLACDPHDPCDFRGNLVRNFPA